MGGRIGAVENLVSDERFLVEKTPLEGVIVLTRKPRGDERGSFQRMYCAEIFEGWGIEKPIAQINLSTTRLVGAVRGLHFQQPPHAELKIVSCTRGAIFDVAVDIRRHSPTFLKWHGEVLSAENHKTMVVPEGFAHGFQVLSPDSDALYMTTSPYAPAAQGGLRPDDAALKVGWPLPLAQVSAQDAAWPLVSTGFAGIIL